MTDLKTILLVEDELIIAMNEARMLRKAGYDVLTAASGEEAIALVRAASPRINLILMDINLGEGLDGTLAAQEILKENDIPILFLSSHTEPEIVAKTEKITSYGYVVKDSGITVLDASIKMAFKLHAANQALRHTNEKLSLAQEASHAGNWDWNIPQAIYDWSPQFRKVFGMDPNAVAGFEAWAKVVHPQDLEITVQTIQDAIDQQTELLVDHRIILPTQEIRWIRATGKTYYEGGQPVRMTGLCIDITERKRIEATLRESEAKYRSLISEMLTGFSLNQLLYDEHGTPVDYVTLEVNKAFETYLNTTRAEVIGRKAGDFLPQDELKHWLDIFGPVVLTSIPARYEMYSPLNKKFFEGLAYHSTGNQFAVTFSDITDRKQADAALRQSQADLLAVFNATSDSVILLAADETVLAINAVGAQRFERPPADIIGHPLSELLPPHIYAQRHAIFNQVLATGQPLIHEDERDGRWMRNRLYPILNDHGQLERLAIFSRDITEQKLFQDALRASDGRFRIISETAGDMIISITLDGKVKYINELAAKALNAVPYALVGQKLRTIVSQKTYKKIWKQLRQLFRTGTASHGEYRLDLPAGSFWLEAWVVPTRDQSGQVIAALCNARDIHERKQTESALLESEARFRGMIDASPIPFALNDEQFNITYLNAAFVRTYGYTLQDIPTLPEWWSRAYPDPEYRQWVSNEWNARLARIKQTGAQFEPMEVKIRCKNGEDRMVIAISAFLVGSPNGVHLAILYDITERKQAEDTIATLLKEKDTLLREVHHRIKNNMNTITSLLRLQAEIQAISPPGAG